MCLFMCICMRFGFHVYMCIYVYVFAFAFHVNTIFCCQLPSTSRECVGVCDMCILSLCMYLRVHFFVYTLRGGDTLGVNTYFIGMRGCFGNINFSPSVSGHGYSLLRYEVSTWHLVWIANTEQLQHALVGSGAIP